MEFGHKGDVKRWREENGGSSKNQKGKGADS